PTGIRTLYLTGCDELKTFRGLDVRRVHRGEAIPTAGSEARDTAKANVADGFRTLSTLAKETSEIRMAKVLFLGSGRCGKTTLAKALRWKMMTPQERAAERNGELDPCPDGGQRPTPNIRLDTMAMPAWLAGHEVTTNVQIWDFGGQEFYHNTHRLFASEGAVFVIVTTSEEEYCSRIDADIGKRNTLNLTEEHFRNQNVYRDLSYWLDFVWEARGLRGATLAKDDGRAPRVLVVFTGDAPAGTNGGSGVLELLKRQAGRYESLVGTAIHVRSARVTRDAFDPAGTCVDDIHRLVSEAAAEVADELGVRVPRLYGQTERKCTAILAANDAHAAARKLGKTPNTPTIEQQGFDQWTDFVCRLPAKVPPSPRQQREISRALASYLHECGRVFHLRHDGTVVIDQRWAVKLVYEVVVNAVATNQSRDDMQRNTCRPFDSSWLMSFFHDRMEVTEHWNFLLGLLDACNILVKVGPERYLAVDPELLGELDEMAAERLTREWFAAVPGADGARLVNHSFAIHDTGAGLVLGRHAFQRVAAAVGRAMHGPLPWLLHFGFDDERWPDSWVRFHQRDAFTATVHVWRDGFQIGWTPADFFPPTRSDTGEDRDLERPGELMLRMEWKPRGDSASGFRGGIFVQMLGSDEPAKSHRLREFLFGRQDTAPRGGDRAGDPERRSPPLGEYRLGGDLADVVLGDDRPRALAPEVARHLLGVGSPGWIHPDGPTNNARFDVAISYRRKASAEFVAALHAALSAAGLLSYYDLEQRMEGLAPAVEGGQAANTLDGIYNTLRRARVLVVVPAEEYFATPKSDPTAADNIFCPVELAEAVVAGTTCPAEDPYHRPARHHFWVRPAATAGGSTHIVPGDLPTKVHTVLGEMYANVIHPRSAPGKAAVPVLVRENTSVRTVASEEPSRVESWVTQCTHGTDQVVEILLAPSGGWDFSAFVARVEALLRSTGGGSLS
ncbi:MAG: hypothetical protein ACKO9B_17670, partial [Planctomycetota bacterium]